MSTQEFETEKLNIMNWISQLQDYSIVEKVKSLMETPNESGLTFN